MEQIHHPSLDRVRLWEAVGQHPDSSNVTGWLITRFLGYQSICDWTLPALQKLDSPSRAMQRVVKQPLVFADSATAWNACSPSCAVHSSLSEAVQVRILPYRRRTPRANEDPRNVCLLGWKMDSIWCSCRLETISVTLKSHISNRKKQSLLLIGWSYCEC